MNLPAPVVVVGVSTVLAAAALALSLFVLWRTKAMVLTADARARAAKEECDAAEEALRQTLGGLSTQLHELQHLPVWNASASPPKPGLNLTKRSHVLRMHRRGDTPEQIAAALEVPLQEVKLLVKVHHIVISNL